jgi:hypothetical protein
MEPALRKTYVYLIFQNVRRLNHEKEEELNFSSRSANETNKEKTEKTNTARPAGLKTRKSFSYTIITDNPVLTLLLLFAQCKMNYW